MMNIILNNRNVTIDRQNLTVSELLRIKKYTFPMLIVKINGELIRKEEYPTSKIIDGDQVMVLHLISGG